MPLTSYNIVSINYGHMADFGYRSTFQKHNDFFEILDV
jgi:hypothetical protein